MAYKRKYKKGELITSLDELAEQEFVYWHDKITAKGWFMGWQLQMICNAIFKWKCLYKAIRVSETALGGNENDGTQPE